MMMTVAVNAQADEVTQIVDRELPRLLEIYKQLHAAPELSYREEKTSSFVAKELRELGYKVTERIGKYEDPARTSFGLVAILENGEGPTVLIRTDLDALPVEEKTGLPYASKVRSENEAGDDVGVMHACGHDVHMTSLLGTARVLSQMKSKWRGKVMLVGQPAEEMGSGALAMLRDGLYERFGRPDYVLALHDNASLAAGKVGYVEGFTFANVDSVEIIMRGVGGHGAYPHTTKDPVVMSAQLILALQTIVSRERPPLDPAVVTVGSIHGGSKSNIISDEVTLHLTVRSYKAEIRKQVLDSIRRVAEGIAITAGVPKERMPIVRPLPSDTPLNATYNDPALVRRVVAGWRKTLGGDTVVEMAPVMGGEDVGEFSLGQKIPLFVFWLGAVDPAKIAKGEPLPSLHSPLWAPKPEPTLRNGVRAMSYAALELLQGR